jgi:hypothetical protein
MFPDASMVYFVAFLSGRQHTVSSSGDGIHVEKATTGDDIDENIHFTDQSQIDTSDGWIYYGKGGELLLWIPALHQTYFVHGFNWAAAYDNNLSN